MYIFSTTHHPHHKYHIKNRNCVSQVHSYSFFLLAQNLHPSTRSPNSDEQHRVDENIGNIAIIYNIIFENAKNRVVSESKLSY